MWGVQLPREKAGFAGQNAGFETPNAGVAVIERGVGLDRVVDREVVQRGQRPVDGADCGPLT